MISVIVPAYNAEATIDRCLTALAGQSVAPESYEIVVVDDGSRDGTVARVRAHPGVRLLSQSHSGPAAARNLGAQQARGEILLFTDADCAPEADWIEFMAMPLQHTAPAPEGKPVVGVKGAYLNERRQIWARFVQLEYEEKYEHMAHARTVDFIDTYAAGYRRDVFLANGGFDPHFPEASVEDQELSFRLARQGYRLAFVPEARVTHWGHAATLTAYWRRKFKIGYWKVALLSRQPGKLLRESHTPQSLRLQIVLLGLAGLGAVGTALWHPLAWAVVIAGLLFLLTTIPFAVKAWGRDRAVSLASPFFLLVRALALGAGFAAGLVARAYASSPKR